MFGINVVREYERVMVFRLGRAHGVRGPGLVIVNPVISRTTLIDLREAYLEIPRQTAITKDNAPISIDFIIFYKVVDPATTVLTVQNFSGAAENLAATTLRAVVGDTSLDDILSKREEMNASLRTRLDDITERWGVKVTNVEVREVNPPPGVQEAMTRQMSAERTRRAQVTEAEGSKAAAILSAEGERQAAITLADGRQQAAVLAAEGERQSTVLRSQGLVAALQNILAVTPGVDQKTMLLQYLDVLREMSSSPSTKFVVPMELTSLLQGFVGRTESDSTEQSGAPPQLTTN
ncbi:MAG: SPFH domain-containing protein [Acidimicrobiales bacterium]